MNRPELRAAILRQVQRRPQTIAELATSIGVAQHEVRTEMEVLMCRECFGRIRMLTIDKEHRLHIAPGVAA